MKNKDKLFQTEVNLLIALKRNKDNKTETQNPQELCFREICTDEPNDPSLAVIIERCRSHGGIWRIHKTVNRRSTYKAMDIIRHKYINNSHLITQCLPSEWKSALMSKDSKCTRNFLLDIDDINIVSEIKYYLKNKNIAILEEIPTPNGYHIAVVKFDTKELLATYDNSQLEIKKDEYIYVKTVSFED